ncbi:AlpA family phage regulatory protein [Xenorhabdus bovienii]|uniref:AlpA family phage regulatory protein n=1 Tax=Xenorhabdus bovienii TaxID=40576 RepID=A0AAJ1J9V4_XENBV|nr:AlpA family phage regulatory protein [Xenorhabdus bovienii]MDE1479882.1 AlpA family phage regulatory protein [Xenorhabdus bovienii]MDE1480857.1 AlpA family phage regulatory protein [Xenorhabdus bovienii]MDE1485646.1 AlpA family phage regulatory protein [Xenorhabdus bovienii]MDE1492089.1 AlpA family phage regulatory protein [Xenorhabdus bovienii]
MIELSVKRGQSPPLGSRSVAFIESEIDSWIQ